MGGDSPIRGDRDKKEEGTVTGQGLRTTWTQLLRRGRQEREPRDPYS